MNIFISHCSGQTATDSPTIVVIKNFKTLLAVIDMTLSKIYLDQLNGK